MTKLSLDWFDPLEKQLSFLQSYSKETVYAGGVGSGKTLCGSVKALVCSTLYSPTIGLVGRQTYQALQDTTKKTLVDGDGDKEPVIPPELIAYRNDSENRIVLKGGSEILFRSFQDFNIEKLLSLNLGWFYVDECTETTEKIWLTLLGRLRHPNGPRIGFGTTNPNGHDWTWRRFHPDSPGRSENTSLLIATTEENHTLPPDYIKQLRTMPKEWQRRFVDCSFDTAAGMIWDMFVRWVHVVPSYELPYEWRRFEAMDHGRRNPTCVLRFAVDPDNNLWVEDEYYSPGLIREHAEGISKLRGARKFPPIIAPPDVLRRDPATNRSIADEYRDLGVDLQIGSDNVTAGLLRVAEWLQRRDGCEFPPWHPSVETLGPDGQGAPRLFISERCENLIREIPDYRWKDLSPSQEKDKDQPEEPRKKDDHACDALRYAVMSRAKPFLYELRPDSPEREPSPAAGIVDQVF